jgi:hypothetical protein
MALRFDPMTKTEPGKMAAGVRFAIPILLAVSGCAQGAEATKPVCNAQIRGEIWPEKAARISGVPIEICSKAARKYRWRQLTVDVSQLKGKTGRKPVIASLAVVTRTKAASAATPSE